eukprot:6200707-Pleurochrysis_carterae.AAC.2
MSHKSGSKDFSYKARPTGSYNGLAREYEENVSTVHFRAASFSRLCHSNVTNRVEGEGSTCARAISCSVSASFTAIASSRATISDLRWATSSPISSTLRTPPDSRDIRRLMSLRFSFSIAPKKLSISDIACGAAM